MIDEHANFVDGLLKSLNHLTGCNRIYESHTFLIEVESDGIRTKPGRQLSVFEIRDTADLHSYHYKITKLSNYSIKLQRFLRAHAMPTPDRHYASMFLPSGNPNIRDRV